ncbi:hypothetical protein B0T13DRAFT_46927 [Neurospora crassa]|nr:hypothetical protein B0T13DRAFT_46927 [Neurospora crassa]
MYLPALCRPDELTYDGDAHQWAWVAVMAESERDSSHLQREGDVSVARFWLARFARLVSSVSVYPPPSLGQEMVMLERVFSDVSLRLKDRYSWRWSEYLAGRDIHYVCFSQFQTLGMTKLASQSTQRITLPCVQVSKGKGGKVTRFHGVPMTLRGHGTV